MENAVVVVCPVPPVITTCVNIGEVLERKVEPVGVNVAVMLCGPTVREEVGKLAEPLLKVTELRGVFPSWNCTEPATLAGVTVAVNVTDCPAVDGLPLEAIAVVVAMGLVYA